MNEKREYVVATRCMTYNQALYIEDALRGFAMQNTTFPAVYIIVDDASTDGEPDVLRKWVESNVEAEEGCSIWSEQSFGQVAEGRLKGHSNSTFVVLLLTENLTQKGMGRKKHDYIKTWTDSAKYIAICEGDDYWIHPEKLQRQYEYMEANPECMLVATNALTLWEEGVKPPSYFKQYYPTGIIDISRIIGNWLFATASLFYRKTVNDNYPEWTRKLYFGDMTLILIAAHRGRVAVLEDITTVYRKFQENKNSITTRLAKKMDYVREQQLLLYEEYDNWTNRKYHDLVEPQIEFLRNEARCYRLSYKNRCLPFLLMPIFMIKRHFKK